MNHYQAIASGVVSAVHMREHVRASIQVRWKRTADEVGQDAGVLGQLLGGVAGSILVQDLLLGGHQVVCRSRSSLDLLVPEHPFPQWII